MLKNLEFGRSEVRQGRDACPHSARRHLGRTWRKVKVVSATFTETAAGLGSLPRASGWISGQAVCWDCGGSGGRCLSAELGDDRASSLSLLSVWLYVVGEGCAARSLWPWMFCWLLTPFLGFLAPRELTLSDGSGDAQVEQTSAKGASRGDLMNQSIHFQIK